jgi:hypothetical protein
LLDRDHLDCRARCGAAVREPSEPEASMCGKPIVWPAVTSIRSAITSRLSWRAMNSSDDKLGVPFRAGEANWVETNAECLHTGSGIILSEV